MKRGGYDLPYIKNTKTEISIMTSPGQKDISLIF